LAEFYKDIVPKHPDLFSLPDLPAPT
jgi:hypothetical protein